MFAGDIMVRLAARCERAHLRIKSEQFAGWGENKGFVSGATIASAHGRAGDQINAEFFGSCGEEMLGLAAVRFGDKSDTHAEAGGEHFRQNDQRIFWRR